MNILITQANYVTFWQLYTHLL